MATYPLGRSRYALLVAALLVLCPGVQARQNAADAKGALLRCDPWTVIKAIDGRSHEIKALQAGAFTDCEVPLSPGRHSLKVCFEANRLQMTGAANVLHVHRCDQDQELAFDAYAGSIHRIKLRIENPFTASIEDVTSTEADLPPSPTVNKSRRVPKAERKSTILVRTSGELPSFLGGSVQNLWFKASRMQQAFGGSREMRPEANGYFTGQVSNGDTLAIRRVLAGELTAFICDSAVPVYEDVPGGRVLYLGDYSFDTSPGGRRFTVSYDEEGARRFMQAHHPEWAGRFETARFRQLRVPEPCLLLPAANRLMLAPGGR